MFHLHLLIFPSVIILYSIDYIVYKLNVNSPGGELFGICFAYTKSDQAVWRKNGRQECKHADKKGEIYGFIGKNGAGKTTLMRLVLGAAMPTGGSIELFGGEESVNETRHRIGALLEYPCIYKNCTALETCAASRYSPAQTPTSLRIFSTLSA